MRNEALNRLPLVVEIRTALAAVSHEIVYVDDGSADATLAIARGLGADALGERSGETRDGDQHEAERELGEARLQRVVALQVLLVETGYLLVYQLTCSRADPGEVLLEEFQRVGHAATCRGVLEKIENGWIEGGR